MYSRLSSSNSLVYIDKNLSAALAGAFVFSCHFCRSDPDCFLPGLLSLAVKKRSCIDRNVPNDGWEELGDHGPLEEGEFGLDGESVVALGSLASDPAS